MRILSLVLVIFTACQDHKYKPECALPGMHKEHVQQNCGKPTEYEYKDGFEIYTYRVENPLGFGKNAKVFFEKNIVVHITSSAY